MSLDALVARLSRIDRIPDAVAFAESVPPPERGPLAARLARTATRSPCLAAAVAALVRLDGSFEFDPVSHGEFLDELVSGLLGAPADTNSVQFVSALNNCTLAGGAGALLIDRGLLCRLLCGTAPPVELNPKLRVAVFAFLHRLACRVPAVATHLVSGDAPPCSACFHAIADHAALGFADGGAELLKLLYAVLLTESDGGKSLAGGAASNSAADWAALACCVQGCLKVSGRASSAPRYPPSYDLSSSQQLRVHAAQVVAVWPPERFGSFDDLSVLGASLAGVLLEVLEPAVLLDDGGAAAAGAAILEPIPGAAFRTSALLILGTIESLARQADAARAGAARVVFGGDIPAVQAPGGGASPLLPASVRLAIEPTSDPQLRAALEAAALALCGGNAAVLARAVGIAPAVGHALRAAGGLE